MNEKGGLRVAVGMSGGVDSSVAALLLKREGHDVRGIFVRCWQDDMGGDCPAGEDAIAAAAAADSLGIELDEIDLTRQYVENVFASFIEELKSGNTPNPDVWCNAAVKFGAFARHAMEDLGMDRIATGHYARIGENETRLLKAEDETKDQSYFLYRVKKKVLEKTLFPVGTMLKRDVRLLAKEARLPTADRQESMGICFVGKRKLREFLKPHIRKKKGNIIDVDGNVLGEHDGVHLYTIGQRQGLGLGGAGDPWYVAGKNAARNEIVAVRGRDDPALFTSAVGLRECSWVSGRLPKSNWVYTCRFRHGMEPVPCTLVDVKGDVARIDFAAKQWGVAPGQAAVIYDGIVCLGGGTIDVTFKAA